MTPLVGLEAYAQSQAELKKPRGLSTSSTSTIPDRLPPDLAHDFDYELGQSPSRHRVGREWRPKSQPVATPGMTSPEGHRGQCGAVPGL